MRPPTMVRNTRPCNGLLSKGEFLHLLVNNSLSTRHGRSGSKSTKSADLPGSIVPFEMPNTLAGPAVRQ